MNKTILYYTCNEHRPEIEKACRKQLLKAELPVVSVSLNFKISFGDVQIVLEGRRSPEMMHEQILRGLKEIDAGYVFLCESDVLYHPCHFDFQPPRRDVFYYNENTYKVDYFTGQAVFYYTKQVSGLCADSDLLFTHYEKRVKRIQEEGKFNRKIGYEPGCHKFPRGIDDHTAERWMSEIPNLDIRHDRNITKSKWSLLDFRNPNTSKGWNMTGDVPYWGHTFGKMNDILERV